MAIPYGWVFTILTVAGAVFPATVSCLYVDTGNPYDPGKLQVSSFVLTSIPDGIPKRAVVYHPTEPGDYAVMFFVPGLGGFVPSFLYDNFLANVSTHGYIVASSAWFVPTFGQDTKSRLPTFGRDMDSPSGKGIMSLFPEEDGEDNLKASRSDTYWKVLIWLQENLATVLSSRAPGVQARFDHLGLSGHSAGAGEIYSIMMRNTSLAQAAVFIEPANRVPEPIDFYLPGLMFGTEYGEETPACNGQGFDFRQNYENWQCPRAMSNVKGFGHCDIMSPLGWNLCRLVNFCKTVPETDLTKYHMFLQGYTAAFYGTYLQNNGDMLKYVTDQDRIPIEFLEFKTDVNC
ncbi:uncharacterized protein [Amphiura filiformis]|uniref:uncharacterized protein n=1 Tax=Amphiura filiformis TaxID=82378 RepID=UPI003B21EFBA